MTTSFPFLDPAFDDVASRYRASRTSFTEEDALRTAFWERGDDASLREDARFRRTPWGRWILRDRVLANEPVYEALVEEGGRDLPLEETLAARDGRLGLRHVVCGADPRIVVQRGRVRLAASQLSDRPRLVDASPLERFTTHLPVFSLRAVAASMPEGGWGPRALEEVPDVIGWVRVDLASRTDRHALFVARIVGDSMDDGRTGLRDGRYAVFSVATPDLDASPIVLVRGAFRDPEAASYALKRFHRPRTSGDVDEVRLVSLNPDRRRYPDIVLDATRPEAVRVVATLVSPLDDAQYERAPRSRAKPGERDLSSRQGLAELHEALEARLEALFRTRRDGTVESADPGAAPAGAEWRARLELGEEGLRLRLAPLAGLPTSVSWLDVAGARAGEAIRASSARVRPTVVPVCPQAADYAVRAGGLDGPWAAALAGLCVRGLDASRAVVFVPGARDAWHRVDRAAVDPGRTVRVVVPPALAAVDLSIHDQRPLGEGWRVAEIVVPTTIPVTLRATLEALGLATGAASLALGWTGTFPRRVEETPAGRELPVWRPDDTVTFTLTSSAPLDAGRAKVFVLGPCGLHVIVLPGGQAWTIQLADLAPGRYLLRALTLSTAVAPEEAVLEIREGALGRWPAARGSVRVEGAERCREVEGAAPPGDLAAWPDPWPVEVQAPPCWPLTGRWRDTAEARLDRLTADEDGRIDLAPWRLRLAPRLATARAGRLEFDLGVLGRAALQHERKADAGIVRREVIALWEEMAGALRDSAEHPAAWFEQWFQPVLQVLGWVVAPAPDRALSAPGVAVAKLLRAGDTQAPPWLLAIVARDRFADAAARRVVSDPVARDRFEGAILSDGICWSLYDARRQRWHKPSSLEDSLAAEEAFEYFFQEFDSG